MKDSFFYTLLILWLTAAACHSPVGNRTASDADFNSLLVKGRNYAVPNPDSALIILHPLLHKQYGDKKALNRGKVLNVIGIAYDVKGMYDSAMYYLLEACRLAEELRNDTLQMSVYENLGLLQFSLKNTDEAVEYYTKSLAIAEKINNAIYIAHQLNNIGNAYMTLETEMEKAIPYFQQCMEISVKNEYPIGAWVAGANLAEIYFGLGELEKAERAIKQNTEQYGVNYYAQFTLAAIHSKRSNYREAIHILKELMKVKQDTREFELHILKNIAETYKLSGNSDSAFVYLEKSYALRDTLHNQRTVQTIHDLKIAYETEKKEHEIVRQQSIIARQTMQRNLFAAGIAICAVFLALLWYMLRLRTRHNRFLAEANATKDRFFNIISHDLKNPAVTLRENMKLLVKNARQWNADTLSDYYAEMLKSSDEQVELINSLLGWAQLQTGRMTCTPGTFTLSDLVSNISLIRNMAEQKGITLNVSVPANALVTCDSNMIATVVRNLLTNAVKFTATGGTVTLKASPNPLPSASPAGFKGGEFPPPSGELEGAFISVSDTGIGMSSEQIRNLYHLDNSQTRRGTAGEKGAGLGLIVCRELLEKHGATLHVESEEGKGSRFWFELK